MYAYIFKNSTFASKSLDCEFQMCGGCIISLTSAPSRVGPVKYVCKKKVVVDIWYVSLYTNWNFNYEIMAECHRSRGFKINDTKNIRVGNSKRHRHDKKRILCGFEQKIVISAGAVLW